MKVRRVFLVSAALAATLGVVFTTGGSVAVADNGVVSSRDVTPGDNGVISSNNVVLADNGIIQAQGASGVISG